jgi:hypothetical protein
MIFVTFTEHASIRLITSEDVLTTGFLGLQNKLVTYGGNNTCNTLSTNFLSFSHAMPCLALPCLTSRTVSHSHLNSYTTDLFHQPKCGYVVWTFGGRASKIRGKVFAIVTGTKFYTLPIALESAAHHGQHEKVSSKFLHTQHKHKSLT